MIQQLMVYLRLKMETITKIEEFNTSCEMTWFKSIFANFLTCQKLQVCLTCFIIILKICLWVKIEKLEGGSVKV